MTTNEVTPRDWKKLGERVGETCRGAMVTIQLLQPDGSTKVAENVPLRNIALHELLATICF